jgi:hypothetical protein
MAEISPNRFLPGRVTLSALLLLTSCSTGDPDSAFEQKGAAASALKVAVGPHAIARQIAERPTIIHGIAGDERLVFVTEPLDGAVIALDRFTGQQVAVLPPPPGGFVLPFSLRVPAPGRLVVFDAGGFPNPAHPAIPRVYDYDYSGVKTGSFSASLARTVRFDGLPVAFGEDIEVAPDGSYLVAESVVGALWVIHPDGSIVPGILPDPGHFVPGISPCLVPSTTIDGLPFHLEGNLGPGALSLAIRDGYVYFGNTCQGGVSRVPLSTLHDASRTPDQRAEDIEVVSARPSGVEVESLAGLAFNRWDPTDDHLYASDSFKLQIIRIDTHTGEREVLVHDPRLFNFPVSLQFLPPIGGYQPLVVASDQEHRLAGINAAITENMIVPPLVIAGVFPIRR